MTPEQAAGLLQYFIPSLKSESATTARVLAAVPDDNCGYTPDEKCMNAQKLAAHIAGVDMWFMESMLRGSFDMSEGDAQLDTKKPSEIVAIYREKMPALIDKVAQLSGEQLAKDTNFFGMVNPLVVYADFTLRHMIHHRGQLSAYLRPMGAKVPAIYGGSADEPMQAAATS
jgi:uncharacterized damage-inducible protein DinB